MPLAIGTRLGPYEILAAIGAGGMGEVYKARDGRLDRIVAVKVLGRHMAGADALQRFEQEARSASALNHPNILTIHDVGRDGDVVYFAMEWVEGGTLRELIAGGRLPLRRALELAQQVAEALAKAHAAGVVHRDLKPENVMVSADGYAKVVDFGLAKFVQGAASEALTQPPGTAPGLVMGSAGYMSPEQASGRDVDYRSDQFALGLLLYEMVTGIRPFARATTAQTLAATIEDEPEPIEQRAPEVPVHLAAVVARCLSKNPADRYESTRDLARDLKAILEMHSRGHSGAAPAVQPRSRVGAALVTLVILLLAGAAAAWRWWLPPSPPAEPVHPVLAVQGFQNLSPDPAQAYFAAGMTEEIRGQLSKVGALRLLSRSAVDAYTGEDLARMIRELGVTSIVEGTVRVEGSRVRIGATLIDAATHQTLWSEQYDRRLADVFAVQSDVALRIAQALQANLTADERARVERRPTANLDAYQLYLKAREFSSSSRDSNLEYIELMRQALALDPEFALARANMAYRMYFLGIGDGSWLPKALEEAQVAVKSDPALPTAHYALASIYSAMGRSAQARISFLRGLELDPSHIGSMNNLSIHEAVSGRLDESLYWARRGFALSAKRGNSYYHVAVPLSVLDWPLMREWLGHGERLAPPSSRVQIMLGMLDALDGRIEEASQRLEAAQSKWPRNEEVTIARADFGFLTGRADAAAIFESLMHVPETYWAYPHTVRLRVAYYAGRRGDSVRAADLLAEAERVARQRIEGGDEFAQPHLELAGVAAVRGDRAAALDALSRAYDAGYREAAFLERNAILAPLATEPRFTAIIERMRTDIAAQLTRARERGLLDLGPLLPQ